MREIRLKKVDIESNCCEYSYICFFLVKPCPLWHADDVSCTVSVASPQTKRQCEDSDALYIYYICLPAQVEDSISEEAGRRYRNQ